MSHAEKKIAIVTWVAIFNPHLLYFMDFLSVEMYIVKIQLLRNRYKRYRSIVKTWKKFMRMNEKFVIEM